MAQNGILFLQQLGLYKQIAERRVGQIVAGWGQHHFGIAGDLNGPRLFSPIHQS
ncbi:hypothetical protein D3C80_1882040 [compost metagenome]